jgi:hypothetical protein
MKPDKLPGSRVTILLLVENINLLRDFEISIPENPLFDN